MDTKDYVWNKNFGKKKNGIDPFGRVVHYDNYQKGDSKGSWNIDHIWPSALKGISHLNNYQVLSFVSNQEKGNKLNGNVNSITFAIKKIHKREGSYIGRMKIKIDEEWHWAYDEQ